MLNRISAALVLALATTVYAQETVPTQALVLNESRSAAPLSASSISLEVDGRQTQLTSVQPVRPADTQIALLIDDGLRSSLGRQIPDIKTFIQGLPAGVEILVGYMQNGRVIAAQPFTRDHAAAAAQLRLPLGAPGVSASPYFCLSDFAKKWPTESATYGDASTPGRKARFVIMLTNGVDPYNGSVSPMNQNSPYVDAAITDAQRAGVSVSSIYYGDAGIRGGAASFSGQSYLSQVADATGGLALYQGLGNPVSLLPFLKQFGSAVANSFIAEFPAPAGKDLVRLRFKTRAPGAKLHAPNAVPAGRHQGTAS